MGPDGSENNMGGVKQFFSYIPWNDVLTFAAPDPADATTDDKYVIKTDHAAKSTKKFLQMYCTIDTAELEAAASGGIDGRSEKLSFKFFHPGSKKEVIKFINESKNDKFMFLVPLTDGTIIQLGSADYCAYVSKTFKTDKTTGRGKGTEFMVECYMSDILIYAGAISYTPAV